jgi:hypothetical protein
MVCLVCGAASVTGCTKTREEDLQAKIDKCTAAGMNYTYLRDFKGDPYEVMCVPKRLR